jgi:signal transduction histidine kinase
VKIRQRLALRFTLVSALITGAILLVIYFFTRGFVHADFVDKLTQQSSLEVLHFATPEVKDVMSAGAFNLVNPSTSIYSVDKNLLYQTGDFQVSESWVYFLTENDVFNAERGEYTTVGRKHIVNGVQYLVFVSDKDLPGEHLLTFLVQASVAGWVVSLVFSFLAGLYFSGDALKPMTQVVNEVNKITEDNLSYRLKVNKSKAAVDEIDELIITFNELLHRIQKAFVAQRRFVQNASHELKTPLTAIMAEVELGLARARPVEEYQRTLHVVLHEAERLAKITQGLLTLTRLEEGSQRTEMSNLQFSVMGNETLRAFKLHHPDHEIVVIGTLPNVFIHGNAHLLETAFLNILDNACKYSEGKIDVTLSQENNHVRVGIRDYGIGIPKNDMQRIRDPLFRAVNAQNISGAGLGLSLVDRIVTVHSGTLEIKSDEGHGTECIVYLPIVSQ